MISKYPGQGTDGQPCHQTGWGPNLPLPPQVFGGKLGLTRRHIARAARKPEGHLTEFRQYGEQSSPKPILLVDDNEHLRQIMARALDEAGYMVLQATDGPEALDVLAVGPQIQLLITDIAMPRMNGVQLASHFMAASHVPVLFISGNPHEPAELPGPILQKPFTPETLVATVKRLLTIMGLHANPM